MFYLSPETWSHVTQMQRCHWPLRLTSYTQTAKSREICVTYLFINVYSVNFYCVYYLKEKTDNYVVICILLLPSR